MMTTRMVTPDELNGVMEFDHVIRVNADGSVDDSVSGVYAPEAHDPDPSDTELNGWTLLNGYSGQYGYAGPWLHNSEFIGGGLARDILATPGLYVAVYATYTDEEDPDGETFIEGWAVAHRADVTA